MSRALTFWNDATIALIREHFVAASVPTWVARAPSPEGEFLRAAGIDRHWVTSSGYLHCVSASGRLLGGRPSAAVLEEFAKLPADERAPGAVRVPDLEPSELVIPSPPAGGLVLRVHARFLARGDGGELRRATTSDFPLLRENPDVARTWALFLEPNTEYLWWTRDEWRALVPTDPQVGQRVAIAPAVVERIARFHLTPERATTSEGGIIGKRSIRTARSHVVVDEVTPAHVRFVLEGFVEWGSEYDASRAITPDGPLAQGFATRLEGRLEYDRVAKTLTRFDIVAPGEIWGRWGDANGRSLVVERPGRAPFGFAFELARGDSPTDRIPPGGNGRYVSESGYFAAVR